MTAGDRMTVQRPSQRGRRRSIWGRAIACAPPAWALLSLIVAAFVVAGSDTTTWTPLLVALLAVALCVPAGIAAIVLGASAVRAGWRRGGRAAVVAGVCDLAAPLVALLILLWSRATS